MVRNGPRDGSARSRNRGAGRAFRTGVIATLVSVLLLPPGVIDAQQDALDDQNGNGAAADAAPPPPPPADVPGDDAIVLNFEKADIREVVHSLAGALGINYLLDPRVEGQVTIRTTGKIPRSDLFPIFNQILRSVGIAAVKVGEVYNIMPIAEAKTRVSVSRADLPGMTADDLFVIELVSVKNVAAQEMVNLLEPFITPGGDVYAYPRANVLIITDIATNVDRLREMVQLLDRDSFKELKARIFKIEHANIDDLGVELLAVLDTYGITGEAAQERGVYVIPLLRLNSIAVLAFNDEMFRAVDYWMRLLDVPPDEELTRTVRVYNVQNAKAADLAIVLNELYGGGEGSSSGGPGAPQRGQPGFGGAGAVGGIRGLGGGGGGLGGGGNRLGGGGGGRANTGLSRTQQLGGGGGLGSSGGGSLGSGSSRTLGSSGRSGGRRGGAQSAAALGGTQGAAGGGASGFVIAGGEGPLSMFKNEVRIVADEIANAIVILATRRDYEQILKVLRDLDVVPRQVVIEVLIAEISLNKSMDMGLQTVLTNPGAVNDAPTPVPTSTMSPTETADGATSILNSIAQTTGTDALKRLIDIAPNNGALTALITDQSSFKITLTALAQAGRAKVLASPNILTADNREASIHIGTEIPILTSQANIAGIQGANGSTALVNNVQYRSTGVILTVLPQVNADGLVNLQVRQEVSEVDQSFVSTTGSPAFTTREAETTAVVQNGDSLLIGGIIQESTSRGRSGVPYLMDIPVLGRLFRVDTDRVRRIELLIMLTPHVIRNRSESLLVTEQYKDRLWDVVDEIERTSGLRPPSAAEMNFIRRQRSRATEAQKPTLGVLPNREIED